MSSYKQFNEGVSRLDGDASKSTLWERMTSKLTKEDVKRITESKEVVVKGEPNVDPYSSEEMRQYMINEAKEQINTLVDSVKRKEEQLSEFSQATLEKIKGVVRLELEAYTLSEKDTRPDATYEELEEEWFDAHIGDDEDTKMWMEKLEGYKIDREVMFTLLRESGNHIKMGDAVQYVKMKYNEDEIALLKQLEDVRQRKSKVEAFEEAYNRNLNGDQDLKDVDDKGMLLL